MTRAQKTYLIAGIVCALLLAIVVAIGLNLQMTSERQTIFIVVLAIVVIAATIVAVVYIRKSAGDPLDAAAADTANLDAIVRSADANLKQAKSAAKSLSAMPLVYVLGDENSGKTQTVLQSGLDAELLAGLINRDGLVPPTELTNIWYTASAAVVEAGGALLRQPGLWRRLISLTAPSKLGAALRKGALQPTRAAVICVSIERVLATNSAASVRSLGQALNEQLRTLSKTLGISLPVYVLFTKLDKIPSFADYVEKLTDDEVRNPFGALLAPPNAGAGLYAEGATTQTSQRFDELCYSLSEFRLEVLGRGGEPDKLARAYEFPRELRKLRSLIVDLLVETGRPSQLGVNPFLRGFYFTGMRARAVEDNFAQPVFQSAAPSPSGDGATRVFSFNASTPVAPIQSARPSSRRVPQWVFLPHLFLRVFLADRGALDSSRASTRVNVVKRVLIGSIAACILIYLAALTISYFNNAALERRLREADASPMQSVSHGDPASTSDLEELEKLRQVFVEVAGYRRNGPPTFHGFGIYPGDKLYNAACSAYGSHFRTLLLGPTQTTILNHLTSLKPERLPNDDYGATYRPLKAYLISTAYNAKSTQDFEPDALQEAWTGGRDLPDRSKTIALEQFKTYSASISEPDSCMASLGGSTHDAPAKQAQIYLDQFQGAEQVYLSMKTAANKKNLSVRFDDKFPLAKPYATDSYLIDGAFTRGGYDFMIDASAHPERYSSGEEWVLGKSSHPPIPPETLRAQIPPLYQAEFLKAWRGYMKTARVVRAGGFAEAEVKLHQLDGNESALLRLFQLISQNTDVPDPVIKQAFQAPQSIVPSTGTALPLGTPYIAGLGSLEGAIHNYLNTPGSLTDPNGSASVLTAALNAETAVNGLRGGFAPDPDAGLDKISEDLLRAPIRSVEDLAKDAPGKIAGGGAPGLCSQINAVLKKFPFNPDAREDATLSEAASVFQPGQGLMTAYAAQGKMVTLQGNTYIPVPGSPVTASHAFINFINAAQTISNTFFPLGGGQPTISFTLRQDSVPNLPPATVDIDGNALSVAGQSKSFVWISSPSSKIRVIAPGGGNNIPTSGQWALFHFAYDAKRPAANVLEEIFQGNGRTSLSDSGVPLDYKFEISGANSRLLDPSFMKSQLHCPTKVAQ